MGLLSSNIKYLRKKNKLTQEEFAGKIGVKRSIIGAYEEERAEPKLQTIQNIAYYFKVSIDALLNTDLSIQAGDDHSEIKMDIEGKSLRILPVVVNPENKELITLVSGREAIAGYPEGYADPDFIQELPYFRLPFKELSQERTYRAFQIKGDSMKPIPSGSYIITEAIENWRDLKDNKCYIILTRDEGLIYKRVVNRIAESNELFLKSDNPDVEPYSISINNVLEAWKALGYVTFTLPDPEDLSLHKLSSLVMELKKDLNKLKGKG